MASKVTSGKIEFLSGETFKEVLLSSSYDSNTIVINISPEENENIYIKKDPGLIDRFSIHKSDSNPNVIYYVVLEI